MILQARAALPNGRERTSFVVLPRSEGRAARMGYPITAGMPKRQGGGRK